MLLEKYLRYSCKLFILIILAFVGVAFMSDGNAATVDLTRTIPIGSGEEVIVMDNQDLSGGAHQNFAGLQWNTYRTWVCKDAAICHTTIDRKDPRTSQTKINVVFSDNHGSTLTLVAYAAKRLTYIRWESTYSQALNQTYNYAQTLLEADSLDRYMWRTLIKFPQEEIRKISYGGVWKAAIELQSYHGNRARDPEKDIKINLTLVVSDSANAQIYFLDTKLSNTSVALPLRKEQMGPNQTAFSENSVDMCLYDGYDANSASYSLAIRDDTDVSENKSYYLRPETNEDGVAEKITFNVEILFNGKTIYFLNSMTPTRLEKAESGSIRLVSLPNVDGEVRCAIATLKLKIPHFNVLEKVSGKYASKLNIIFTANA